MDKELKPYFQIEKDILLRTYQASDAEAVFEAALRNRERLEPFMHWMTADYSLASAKQFIVLNTQAFSKKSSAAYGIFRDRTFLGSIGFVYFDWSTRKTEIGYWLTEEAEGKGIVSSGCRVLIDYAFAELDMNRIEIKCSTENPRSYAVAERLGFTKEAHLRQAEFRNGKFHDFYIYGLLAADQRLW